MFGTVSLYFYILSSGAVSKICVVKWVEVLDVCECSAVLGYVGLTL